jgi:ferredoxin
MTHYVGEECLKCKYTDCVEVCPVDCFYEDSEILVIDPEECIDCGVCIPECPVNAIKTDEDVATNSEMQFWLSFNALKTKVLKKDKRNNITEIKDPLPEHEKYKNMKNKKEFLKSDPVCKELFSS